MTCKKKVVLVEDLSDSCERINRTDQTNRTDVSELLIPNWNHALEPVIASDFVILEIVPRYLLTLEPKFCVGSCVQAVPGDPRILKFWMVIGVIFIQIFVNHLQNIWNPNWTFGTTVVSSND